ncbi:hypothetical protein [Mucilaginibacter sp. SJ]|uniref:hypothetical protein n=1 Tax=Mucilaginibacter sp. SJ TaxID=3029053 RepID=UPI0023A9BE36|nr:hypothetical protein [Mucilaginibacter sp. SJ]WEA02091.1 hypothetical protein MusilaSJ_04025 [Mucilaginibacter sp. SJ]
MQLFITLITAACKKGGNSIETADTKQSDSAIISTAGLQPANSANLFDSVGVWHNTGLNYVLAYLNDRKQTRLEQVNQATIMFGHEVMNIEASPKMLASLNRVLADSAAHFRNIIAKAPLSAAAKTWLQKLFETVEKANPQNPDYTLLKQNLIAIENDVAIDAKLSLNEKQAILGTASVARYSAYYWLNFQGFNPGSIGKLKNIIKFIAQVTSDMAGVVEGFINTGTSGGMIQQAIDTSSAMAILVIYSIPLP